MLQSPQTKIRFQAIDPVKTDNTTVFVCVIIGFPHPPYCFFTENPGLEVAMTTLAMQTGKRD